MYAVRKRVPELEPEPELEEKEEPSGENWKLWITLRAMVAERMCENSTLVKRRDPAGTGFGGIR